MTLYHDGIACHHLPDEGEQGMAPSNIIIEHDIEIVLRDGTRTHADVYRPDDGERHPVILSRTIYGKTGLPSGGLGNMSDYYSSRTRPGACCSVERLGRR
jgi:predicted acyl esterase